MANSFANIVFLKQINRSTHWKFHLLTPESWVNVGQSWLVLTCGGHCGG